MPSRMELLKELRIYDLAQPLEQGMGQSPNHPPFRLALTRRHGDTVRPDGGSAAAEMIVTGGHVGTHIDALCHVSQDGQLFGGVDAAAAQTGGRFAVLGVDTIKPIVRRGILLDVAGFKGVDILSPGYAISADDLKATAAAVGVEPGAGDVVLIRTGWASHWSKPAAYVGHDSGVPGPDESAAVWLADFGIHATGSDTIAFECIYPGAGHRTLPVHRLLLVERGIHIMETLYLEELAHDRQHEFIFVGSPLKITGATGSPIRPLALV